ERRSRDKRFRGERCLGDAEQQRTARCRTATVGNHLFIFLAEAELIDLLLQQEAGIAHVFHLHPAHHLADNHLNVLVTDGDTLQTIDLLDFVHQVSLQFLFAEYGKNVVRVERAIHQRLTGANTLAFLHVDVNTLWHRVFFFRSVIGHHIDFALAFAHFAELQHAINFTDDRGFARLAGFKQLDHAWQTTGDVFRLGGFTWDVCQHVARMHLISILHHQVRARRHEVTPG